jgi:ribonuclease III
MIDLDVFQNIIEYKFKNSDLLKQALCHKSYNKENPDCPHNEKLEFLGDAVIDLVVSDLLMQEFSEVTEGSLSRKRASVVNEDRLFQLAKQRTMDESLFIGERESKNNLRQNPRIVASVFEAVVGAIYKDAGYDIVYKWLVNIFKPVIEEAYSEHDFESDYKTRFQEWVQEEHKKTPRYVVINQTGPDHQRLFEVEVFIGDQSWGIAQGGSKKMAAQNAAKQAIEKVKK